MSGITLGRYVPHDTFIHKLDPRTKIAALVVLMVAVFFSFPTYLMTFVIDGLLLVFTIFLMLNSKVKFSQFFGSLKGMWFFILLLMVINVFIPGNDNTLNFASLPEVAFTIKNFDVYWCSIWRSLKIILRLVMMLELTMILTSTTSSMDLTYALEWYMTPLKVIRFPAHEIAMTISLAIRLIPTLLDETERIMKAQSSRGVDFKHGKLKAKAKAITSLIIPLFVSAFQRSDELANAMEARGYNPQGKRTRYRIMHFSLFDLIALVLTNALLAGVIVLSVLNITIQTELFVPSYLIVILGSIILFIIIAIFAKFFFKKVEL